MRKDIETLSSRIDSAKQLCKKVLDFGEKVKSLSPEEIGMDAYTEKVEQITSDRARVTREAIKELNSINVFLRQIESDSAINIVERAFLAEKVGTVQAFSPLFAQQNSVLKKCIEKHLTGMRQDAVEFHKKVDVIKTYLKTPDRRTFYG
ncbi:MAG: hypothetical protein LBH25_03080 [Fibromonadaceae bacterium]|jgi:hypothetical protein|nr:hypothetical protein [Fibromonadaceae bacterium]